MATGRGNQGLQTLVWGKPTPADGRIQTHIGRHPKYRQLMAAEVPRGKWADSRYKTVAAFPEASKLNVHILTGRTHQIRVHLSHIGHPVVGDALYGKTATKTWRNRFYKCPNILCYMRRYCAFPILKAMK